MRFLIASVTAFSILSAPAQAAPDVATFRETRPGAFVGLRLVQPLGSQAKAPARAMFTLAPTRSASNSNARLHTSQIGEGIALTFQSRRPALTIAGLPAGQLLSIGRQSHVDPDRKQNLSTGTTIAIGVGAVLVAGLLIYVSYCDDKISSLCGNSDE